MKSKKYQSTFRTYTVYYKFFYGQKQPTDRYVTAKTKREAKSILIKKHPSAYDIKVGKGERVENHYHRNGEVTFWDVYRQCWQRLHAARISDRLLATMNDKDRDRIARHAERYPCTDLGWVA